METGAQSTCQPHFSPCPVPQIQLLPVHVLFVQVSVLLTSEFFNMELESVSSAITSSQPHKTSLPATGLPARDQICTAPSLHRDDRLSASPDTRSTSCVSPALCHRAGQVPEAQSGLLSPWPAGCWVGCLQRERPPSPASAADVTAGPQMMHRDEMGRVSLFVLRNLLYFLGKKLDRAPLRYKRALQRCFIPSVAL